MEAGWLNFVGTSPPASSRVDAWTLELAHTCSRAVTPHERRALFAKLTRLQHRALARPPPHEPSPASSEASDGAEVTPTGDFAAVSRRALRLFASIYALTNAYENLVLGLVLRRKPVTAFLRDLRSLSAFRLAAFVAAYSSVYRILLHQLRTRIPAVSSASDATPPARSSSYRPSLRRLGARLGASPYLPPFLAGVLAAPTILIEGSGQRRVTIALYVLTRAVQGAWDGVAKTGVVPSAMREGRWWWGGHLLFAYDF